jgi:hypothetical protein
MKTQTSFYWFPTLAIAAALTLAACSVSAQVSANASAGQTAPLLSYGVNQIIQLSQAKVADDTIVNFIHNSGSSYGLDADQIVYLKQQGVSDTVINTMLNQPRLTEAAAPAAATATSTATATVNIFAQPEEPYYHVDPIYVASSSVYVIPDTQTYFYNTHSSYPYYGGRTYRGYYRPSYYGTHYSFGAGYGGAYRSSGHQRGGWHR